MTARTPFRTPDDHDAAHGAPPRDELDGLLRDWHDQHRAAASAQRDRLLEAVASDARHRPSFLPRWARPLAIAASLGLVIVLGVLFSTATERTAFAGGLVMVPEAGRLDAIGQDGALIGPCVLKHTKVDASVAGPFARVHVRQQYQNTYPVKVEAVYTFPLSHRGAVDRMTMTVVQPDGERVVVGEVRERSIARAMYEAAREQGYVASLLEQERPNIFTQSVANIEPGARVDIEISYVETLVAKEGTYSFDFPTVVGPRYIPGGSTSTPPPFPCQQRLGVVLLAPATGVAFDGEVPAWVPGADALPTLLSNAYPMTTPQALAKRDGASTCGFTVTYGNKSQERCMIFDDGSGWVNGRWFWVPGIRAGAPFATPTPQVPDADRITPMPVPPGMRAGHDLSIAVTVDTGGIPILSMGSELHPIRERNAGGSASRRAVELANGNEIPNRDFILSWKVKDDAILEATNSHWSKRTAPTGMGVSFDATSVPAPVAGGYLTLVIAPPAAVVPAEVPARELIFVLDTSGSMNGFPIEKAKEVMAKAIGAMRPVDTFNVITFAGDTHVLWPEPRSADASNVAQAQAFIGGQRGGGGTEMMKAIEAALVQRAGAGLTPTALIDLPADGREVRVLVPCTSIVQVNGRSCVQATPQVSFPFTSPVELPSVLKPEGVVFSMAGAWATVGGERVLQVREAGFAPSTPAPPMRICMFLTDAYVGNDRGIVAAVRENAGTTRVFSFGIGNSVNRWLIDEMARAGRGESEIVTLAESADEAVARFAKRIQTPVLADVQVAFEGFEATAVTPALIPDLFDVKPLVVHARYAAAGSGTVVVRGRTGAGPWERRIPVQLAGPGSGDAADMLPSLWARSQADDALAPVLKELEQESVPADVRRRVTSLGEGWQIMTPFTSFVAIEKARVTLGGRALLVPVPIELPQGTRWEGFFGEWHGGAIPQMGGAFGDGGDRAGADGAELYFGVPVTAEGRESLSKQDAKPAGEKLKDQTRVLRLGEAADPRPAGEPTGGLVAPSSPPPAGSVAAPGPSQGGFAFGGGGGMGGGGGGGSAPGLPGGSAVRGAQSAGKVLQSQTAANGRDAGDERRHIRGRESSAAMKRMESAATPEVTPGSAAEPAKPARPMDPASGVAQQPAAPAELGQGESGRAVVGDALERQGAGRQDEVDADAQAPRDGTTLPAPSAEPTAPAEDPVIEVHDVRDLVGVGAGAAIVDEATTRLVRELQKVTGRELWVDQGGRSIAWSAKDGLLMVDAWPSVQRTIAEAIRTRRTMAASTGGIDRDLVSEAGAAAARAAQASLAPPMTADALSRAMDLLGRDLAMAALMAAALPHGVSAQADGTIWVSIGVGGESSVGSARTAFERAGLLDASTNDAARVVFGRILPSKLPALVQEQSVTALEAVTLP